MQSGQRPLCIQGGGPAALVAATLSARAGRQVFIGAQPAPSVSRTDAVPAPLLAFLVELGVHPQQLGADTLYDSSLSSWRAPTPEVVRGARKAHVDRSRLESQLLSIATRAGARLVDPSELQSLDGDLVDASGRRAVFASRIFKPVEVWVARTFRAAGSFSPAQSAFRIAPLRDGYAYRLGSSDSVTIGVVSVFAAAPRSARECDAILEENGAAWIRSGFDALQNLDMSRGGVSSVQIATSECAIGDATFAPDALASEGLAFAVNSAVAFVETRRRDLENVESHLNNLGKSIEQCRFARSYTWRTYGAFVEHTKANLPDLMGVAAA